MGQQTINIAFTNDTNEVQSLTLFKNGDSASEQGNSYVFTLPYAAVYTSYFRVKVDDVDHSFFCTGPTTKEAIVTALNSLGIGTWSIRDYDPDSPANIFTGFDPIKNIQEFEVIDLAVDENGLPILDENNEPMLL